MTPPTNTPDNPPPDAPQLPPNLPPLPPVPDGYDRWEYRGIAWIRSTPGPYMTAKADDPTDVWRVGDSLSTMKAYGIARFHYIEAVKSEHPAAPRFNLSKDHCLKLADLEGDQTVGAGCGEHPASTVAGEKVTIEELQGKLADMLAKAPEPPVTDSLREIPVLEPMPEGQFIPEPRSLWLVVVECRYNVITVCSSGEGFYIPGQEPCWRFDHVAEWIAEIKPEDHLSSNEAVTAAQDDSKRLEWLEHNLSYFYKVADLDNPIRDEIDAAMREGDL